MIRILMLCPNPNDATSYYRGMGPFSRLAKDNKNIACYTTTELDFDRNWSALAMADIVFMQRPYHQMHLRQAHSVRRAGIPLWVDFDDNQSALAFENPAYDVYMSQESQDAVRQICEMADVVTVSTPALEGVYGKYNSNTQVIRNAVDEKVFALRPVPTRTKTIVWRGGQAHERDLDSVSRDLISISHDPKFADWTFHFIGPKPWRLLEKMRPSHTHWSEGVPMMEYLEKLWQTGADFVIVPLVDDVFNKSKSNIAAMEGLYAGAVPIVPAGFPEFDLPGCWPYTAGDFGNALRAMMEMPGCDAMVSAGWDYVVQNLSLKKANERRVEIINNLLASPAGIRWESV